MAIFICEEGTELHDFYIFFFFMYKTLLHVLPDCLTNLISFRTFANFHTRLQESLILNIPTVKTELGKTAFQLYAPQNWNYLQCALELNPLISLDSFKCLLFNVLQSVCNCNL